MKKFIAVKAVSILTIVALLSGSIVGPASASPAPGYTGIRCSVRPLSSFQSFETQAVTQPIQFFRPVYGRYSHALAIVAASVLGATNAGMLHAAAQDDRIPVKIPEIYQLPDTLSFETVFTIIGVAGCLLLAIKICAYILEKRDAKKRQSVSDPAERERHLSPVKTSHKGYRGATLDLGYGTAASILAANDYFHAGRGYRATGAVLKSVHPKIESRSPFHFDASQLDDNKTYLIYHPETMSNPNFIDELNQERKTEQKLLADLTRLTVVEEPDASGLGVAFKAALDAHGATQEDLINSLVDNHGFDRAKLEKRLASGEELVRLERRPHDMAEEVFFDRMNSVPTAVIDSGITDPNLVLGFMIKAASNMLHPAGEIHTMEPAFAAISKSVTLTAFRKALRTLGDNANLLCILISTISDAYDHHTTGGIGPFHFTLILRSTICDFLNMDSVIQMLHNPWAPEQERALMPLATNGPRYIGAVTQLPPLQNHAGDHGAGIERMKRFAEQIESGHVYSGTLDEILYQLDTEGSNEPKAAALEKKIHDMINSSCDPFETEYVWHLDLESPEDEKPWTVTLRKDFLPRAAEFSLPFRGYRLQMEDTREVRTLAYAAKAGAVPPSVRSRFDALLSKQVQDYEDIHLAMSDALTVLGLKERDIETFLNERRLRVEYRPHDVAGEIVEHNNEVLVIIDSRQPEQIQGLALVREMANLCYGPDRAISLPEFILRVLNDRTGWGFEAVYQAFEQAGLLTAPIMSLFGKVVYLQFQVRWPSAQSEWSDDTLTTIMNEFFADPKVKEMYADGQGGHRILMPLATNDLRLTDSDPELLSLTLDDRQGLIETRVGSSNTILSLVKEALMSLGYETDYAGYSAALREKHEFQPGPISISFVKSAPGKRAAEPNFDIEHNKVTFEIDPGLDPVELAEVLDMELGLLIAPDESAVDDEGRHLLPMGTGDAGWRGELRDIRELNLSSSAALLKSVVNGISHGYLYMVTAGQLQQINNYLKDRAAPEMAPWNIETTGEIRSAYILRLKGGISATRPHYKDKEKKPYMDAKDRLRSAQASYQQNVGTIAPNKLKALESRKTGLEQQLGEITDELELNFLATPADQFPITFFTLRPADDWQINPNDLDLPGEITIENAEAQLQAAKEHLHSISSQIPQIKYQLDDVKLTYRYDLYSWDEGRKKNAQRTVAGVEQQLNVARADETAAKKAVVAADLDLQTIKSKLAQERAGRKAVLPLLNAALKTAGISPKQIEEGLIKIHGFKPGVILRLEVRPHDRAGETFFDINKNQVTIVIHSGLDETLQELTLLKEALNLVNRRGEAFTLPAFMNAIAGWREAGIQTAILAMARATILASGVTPLLNLFQDIWGYMTRMEAGNPAPETQQLWVSSNLELLAWRINVFLESDAGRKLLKDPLNPGQPRDLMPLGKLPIEPRQGLWGKTLDRFSAAAARLTGAFWQRSRLDGARGRIANAARFAISA
jgi:hypothetical protein